MDGAHARHVETLLGWIKDGPPGAVLLADGHHLQGATWEDAGDAGLMARLAAWHGLSPAGARRWLIDEVLTPRRRALFWVMAGGEAVGHVGLANFDFTRGTVAVDDRHGDGAALAEAAAGLARWAGEALALRAAAGGERVRAA